ncbi:MAG TPA: hypothetical protein VN285_02980 [Candidatus Deferrimicrobium sp.]|nr:hypothetical protein [Candidatus Deferrimicrobium sp.]
MKKAALLGLVFGTVILALAVIASETAPVADKPWFDMQNCYFCQNLVKDPHLMENMTWEHHDIANGELTITTVKPEFKQSYLDAQTAMMKCAQEMQAGKKDVPLCGHCTEYGALAQAGVTFEYVQGKGADIVLMTSDKPELVARIKAFGQRNRDELVKWEEAEKAKATPPEHH